MTEIVAADIGGTHARFAIARIEDGRVVELDEPCTLKTADYAGLQTAWEAFGARLGRPLPTAAAIAVAASPDSDVLKLTNCPWVLQPSRFREQLGVEHYALINDFGAVGHAVSQLEERDFRHVCGPDLPLPREGAISIIGPGTGLGVSLLLRGRDRNHVIETEGGHIDFAPLDSIEDNILALLRQRYRRVSVERVASGPGLANIHEALAALEQRPVRSRDERELWAAALAGEDSLAASALDRFCLCFGAIAGDIALAQGAAAVVIAGGIGLRLADRLPGSGFAERFAAKGRFEHRMSKMPVKLITHPQPGLLGAAAAFAQSHRE